MFRWMSVALCCLAMISTAQTAHARADHREAPLTALRTVEKIDWGGAVSRGPMKVSGLPAIQSARESARLKTGESTRSAPGERVSRPRYGTAGRPSGRRTYEPIVIRKRIDKASPLIRRLHKGRRTLSRVVMRGRDASGHYHNIVLKQARVVSHRASRSGDIAMEEITLVFEYIERVPV